ncbi:MAG: heliorhodopsin HeR [Eubacteriales bacterium]|nr:heliorhodopsin HeR [Eubacteriales bacterium]
MAKEINYSSLRKFNLIMGILHFVQGAFMLVTALSIDKFSAFKLPLFSNFLKFDQVKMTLVTDNRLMGEVPFAVCVSIFLFLSAFFHFLIVLPGSNEVYNRNIGRGINPFRWYEYALSSSLMIVLLSLLFGIYDIGAIIAIFLLNASMNLFGLLMERINLHTEKTDWYSFIFGCVAGIGPWILVFMHAFGNSDLSKVPWFVYAIFASYFVFFNLFPVNMVLQYKKVGKWANYIYGERGYIILSLVAKTILAWLVFAGVMQP